MHSDDIIHLACCVYLPVRVTRGHLRRPECTVLYFPAVDLRTIGCVLVSWFPLRPADRLEAATWQMQGPPRPCGLHGPTWRSPSDEGPLPLRGCLWLAGRKMGGQ